MGQQLIVLAVDPGETTGFVKAGITVLDQEVHIWAKWGEWEGMEGLINQLDLFVNLDFCIIEDYLIYPNRAQSHIGNRVYTAREIGRIEWICLHHCGLDAVHGKVIFQMASQAKQLWPNSRIKNYLPPALLLSNHETDATRHLFTWIENRFNYPTIICKEWGSAHKE